MKTIGELQDLLYEVLQHEGIERDHRIGVEYNGYALDISSLTVIVSSDLWEAGMVVLTTGDVTESEEGEADDG